MKNLNALRDEVFEINKGNGWYEEKRSFGELIALVHSEVSEALEDYRNGKAINEVWYEYKKSEFHLVPEGFKGIFESDKPYLFSDEIGLMVIGKPCGIPSELADIVIRILDICGLYGWDVEKEHMLKVECELTIEKLSFTEKLTHIHALLSESFGSELSSTSYLDMTIQAIEHICESNNINLEQTIQEKLAYNRTRGYKHGGKVI